MDLLGEMLLQEEECYLQQKLYLTNMERPSQDRDLSSRYKMFLLGERLLASEETHTVSVFFRVLEMWVLGLRS